MTLYVYNRTIILNKMIILITKGEYENMKFYLKNRRQKQRC